MSNDTPEITDPRINAALSELTAMVVAGNDRMSTNGFVAFADGAKVVPVTTHLKGGPDFFRMNFPPTLPTRAIIVAINTGGAEDLTKMMDLIGESKPTRKTYKRLMKAGERFVGWVLYIASVWDPFEEQNQTRH